jgi:MFS transporter, DHA1 family, tetracycline resistance protein
MIVFMDLFGFGLILPLLPYIAKNFSATPATIGYLTASYSFFQFIAGPILGRLSDKYGRKKLLIISQLGSALGFVVLAFANSLPLLFLSRIIDGTTGGNISIAQAYIADITTKKNRARGMGLLGAAFGLGFMFGPAIGGYLSQFGFATPAIFATSIACLTSAATAIFLKETVKKSKLDSLIPARTKPNLSVLTKAPLNYFILTFFVISLGFSGMQSTFALLVESKFNWGPREVGYIFALVGIIAIISQIKILPYTVKKWGEKKTLLGSLPVLASGLALMGITRSIIGQVIANTLLPLGNSLINPTLTSLASKNVDQDDYGTTLGFLQSASSLGRIIGPIFASQLFQIFSPSTPFIVSSIIILIVFLFLRDILSPKTSFLTRLFS